MSPDYEWALECWREMMAKYKAGRPLPEREKRGEKSARVPGRERGGDLVSRLRSYDSEEGCINKTEFVPIHRKTLREIVARLEALEAIEPYLDTLLCYASGTEYAPNAAVKKVRDALENPNDHR